MGLNPVTACGALKVEGSVGEKGNGWVETVPAGVLGFLLRFFGIRRASVTGGAGVVNRVVWK